MLADDLGVNPSWLMLTFIRGKQDCDGYGVQAMGNIMLADKCLCAKIAESS